MVGGGTSQELGIRLKSDAIDLGVFCHSLWLWSERKDLGMKPSGWEDKGQGSSFWAYRPSSDHSRTGKTGVRPHPAKGSPSQKVSDRGHPSSNLLHPGAAPPSVLLVSQVGLGVAHCSSSQEGFSAPGGRSLMLNCCRVCSSCFWFPAK